MGTDTAPAVPPTQIQNSTQGNSGKLTTFWVDTEIPKMPHSTLGMRPDFRCFLVLDGVLLPQVHGGDGQESQQGLPGNQDPQACLGNFSVNSKAM